MTRPSFASPSLVAALLLGGMLSPAAEATAPATRSVEPAETFRYETADASHRPSSLWLVGLGFATTGDAEAFRMLADRIDVLQPPDARGVARAFVRERLGLDGDDYVVAHFRSADDRRKGVPDHTVPLTDALMEAFPDHARHTFFAGLSDLVGGLNNGGTGSVGIVQIGEHALHAGDLKTVFAEVGDFLWSRTGPGYLYKTFFAKGNVVETVGEDSRALDEAFGVYRTGGFTRRHEASLPLSRIVDAFKAPGAFAELPYVKRLEAALDAYWKRNRADWPVLARYQFVLRARLARDAGQLTQAQYELVMRGGAPHVPLAGPVSMAQIRATVRPGGVDVRRFDINGYTATNLVRFVAADGSEVMYVPGRTPSFVVAADESALRRWVLEQAKDPKSLDALLAHFSVRDGQDGVFWTGVKHGLENLGSGRWQADGSSVDHANAAIDGDVFEDMRASTERRMRDDAGMRAGTAWEAWRDTVNRTATLLGPLGFVRPLVVPVQVALGAVQTGTGIEQAIDGRTMEERKNGLEQAGMTVITNVALGGFLGRQPAVRTEETESAPSEPRPFFVPPKRLNGKLGYPMSPTRAPGIPGNLDTRLYLNPFGKLVRWSREDLVQNTIWQLPRGASPAPSGTYVRGTHILVKLRGRVARVVPDGNGYRFALRGGEPGPRLARHADGFWDLALADDSYVKGSVLAQGVDESYTTHPDVLHRAGEILDQLGSSEANLLELGQARMGALTKVATGQALIETLPGRLRDPYETVWNPRELELVAPEMARAMHRSLALYGEDGSFQFGVSADGAVSGEASLPANVLKLRRYGRLYTEFREGASSADQPRARSIFQMVGARVGYNLRDSETYFRQELALHFDARSTRPELDIVHGWIDQADLPAGQRQMLEDMSRMRHAVFDRYTELTPQEKDRLQWADAVRHATLFPGQPYSHMPFDDLMAKVADEEGDLLPAETDRLTDLLARVGEGNNALLPPSLHSLLVEDPLVLQDSATRNTDQWTMGVRHYVRLRHLDGRMQIVETAPYLGANPYQPGRHIEILAPGQAMYQGTGHYVFEAFGAWFFQKSF